MVETLTTLEKHNLVGLVSKECSPKGSYSTRSGEGRPITEENLLSQSLAFKLRKRQRKPKESRHSRERKALVRDFLNGNEAWASDDTNQPKYVPNIADKQRPRENQFPSLNRSSKVCGAEFSQINIARDNKNTDIDTFSDLMANDKTCYKSAMDAVSFQSVGGLFLHPDKYGAGRFTRFSGHSPTPSGETILLGPDGTWHRPERHWKRKNRHHARSAKSDGALKDKVTHIQRETTVVSQHGTNRGMPKAKGTNVASKKYNVSSVGVNWKSLPVYGSDDSIVKKSDKDNLHIGKLSHNVLPMTIGADHRGTSVSKTKWVVPRLQNHQATQVWLQGLNFVKKLSGHSSC